MNSNVIAFPARKPLRKIVLDAETSGLYPEDGHRIVELAAIEINDREITKNLFHQLFNPEREVDEGAAEVHGLTWEELQNEPTFAEYANQIAEFIRDAELIIHNAPFDVNFLNSEFQRVGLPPVEDICARVTDTLAMAKKLNPGEMNNLNALCERYGIDESQYFSHGAMLDAEILAEIYLKMIKEGKARKPLDGILAGTDEIIDQHLLGLPPDNGSRRSYRHKGEASNLRPNFDAEIMLRNLMGQIQENLKHRESYGNSKENWREGYSAIREADKLEALENSPEVLLERTIAKELLKKTDTQQDSPWWNQMPIASGLVSPTADRRRAIDLVHRHSDGKSYDFVELKIDSDTPLFALTEILRYGLVYLVLRHDRTWLSAVSRKQPVFDAKKIGLQVLAPQEYYKNYGQDLSWIEDKINRALPKVIGELNLSLPLVMDIGSYFHERLKKDLDEEILAEPLSVLDVVDWKRAYP